MDIAARTADTTLDALSKISSMKAFAEMHKPTHPLRRGGPLRHGAISRRLAFGPYSPPPLCQRQQRAQNASAKHLSTSESSPLASIAMPAPAQTTTTQQATTSAQAVAYEEHAFNSNSISTLLTQWLKEGQQLNVHFSTEVTAIQREISSLQGLARSMVRKVGHDSDVAPPAQQADDHADDWKPSVADGASAGMADSVQVRTASARRTHALSVEKVKVALSSSEDTQASDSDWQ